MATQEVAARIVFTVGCSMTTLALSCLIFALNPTRLDRRRLRTGICLKALVIGSVVTLAGGICLATCYG